LGEEKKERAVLPEKRGNDHSRDLSPQRKEGGEVSYITKKLDERRRDKKPSLLQRERENALGPRQFKEKKKLRKKGRGREIRALRRGKKEEKGRKRLSRPPRGKKEERKRGENMLEKET